MGWMPANGCYEVRFLLRPHLVEFIESMCGRGALRIDPDHIVGRAVCLCLQRKPQPRNDALREDRKPVVFTITSKQRDLYGRHIGPREQVSFERLIMLLFEHELQTYVDARRAAHPATPIMAAVRDFLDERDISVDHISPRSIYEWCEGIATRTHRRRDLRAARTRTINSTVRASAQAIPTAP